MKHFQVDMTVFKDLSYKLLQEIRENGKKYRAILCPLRGGFPLSYFMSRHLNLHMVYIEINSYVAKEQGEFKIGIKSDLEEDQFLLCDDIYDSGKTIAKIHEIYPRVKFDTACLISKVEDADIYYGEYVPPYMWVDFYWEKL